VLFAFVWTTLVYCVLTHWVWAPGGWAFKWGVMDYAGGGPVEIGSGVGGLAYAFVLGSRKEDQLVNFRYVPLLLHSVLKQFGPRAWLTYAFFLFSGGHFLFSLLPSGRPHNVSLICLGTFLLWFGWLGFNAGSAFGANLRAIYAAWNSNIMAATVSYFRPSSTRMLCTASEQSPATH
jgi:Amt family ammonium transporter